MKGFEMRIPVVVVTYDSAKDFRKWLKSVRDLEATGDCSPVPFVCDNGSSDETLGLIWQAIRDGSLTKDYVLWIPKNIGFTAAHNYVFKTLGMNAETKYFATLNPDATADPQWLRRLVAAANEDAKAERRVGMWCGPIFCPDVPERISSLGHGFRSRDGAFLDVGWNRA
jgi:GT2 family glycosyltransferase